MPLDSTQRARVRRETIIATLACGVLPTLAVGLWFPAYPVALRGIGGVVDFALRSTAVAVFFMTLLMSLGTRAAVRKGSVRSLARADLPWLAWVPRRLGLRVPLLAVAAALAMAAGTALVAGLMAWPALERPAFLAFVAAIGALTGSLATPVIQCAALADPGGGAA